MIALKVNGMKAPIMVMLEKDDIGVFNSVSYRKISFFIKEPEHGQTYDVI